MLQKQSTDSERASQTPNRAGLGILPRLHGHETSMGVQPFTLADSQGSGGGNWGSKGRRVVTGNTNSSGSSPAVPESVVPPTSPGRTGSSSNSTPSAPASSQGANSPIHSPATSQSATIGNVLNVERGDVMSVTSQQEDAPPPAYGSSS